MLLDRQLSYACIHPNTYKYFFSVDSVVGIWRHLSERYGKIERIAGFGTMQIDGRRFLFRSVAAGNPITVIRKRRCNEEDIRQLHNYLGCTDVVASLEAAPKPQRDGEVK